MRNYITSQSRLPPFMAFPRFLLKCNLSETTKLLYILLLDRARVSMKTAQWQDTEGHVYLHYTIRELADDLSKSEMTIKNALAALERAKLIERRRQRNQRVNCIYVLLAEGTENCPQEGRKLSAQETKNCPPGERNLSAAQTENCPSHGQKTVCDTDRKLSPNRNNRERIKEKERLMYMSPSMAFGQFHNVFLTEKQVDTLQQSVPGFGDYVERLSRYMASTGKKYADHAATILDWAARDQQVIRQVKRDYSCQEGESL
ncbi:MAG: replication initiator protein A [Anaerolineaceae bacterium]|nr:replication initiator protein A [Anaerolineaceae bacterium]